jgi:hypothetical protein
MCIALALSCGLLGYWIGVNQDRQYLRSSLQWQFSEAADRGDVTTLIKLHRSGAKIDAIPGDGGVGGYPAILVASLRGNQEAVAWLIKNGANVNVAMGPDTPLSVAEAHLRSARGTVALLKANGAKHWNE